LRTVVGTKDVAGSFTIASGSYFDVNLGFGTTRVTLTPGIIALNNIENALQQNLNAFLGPDVITVSRNSFGRIVLAPVNISRTLTITNVSSDDPLGISPHTISGPDLGDQPAQLNNGISTLGAFDFSATNGTFVINIDGAYSETLTLAQNYPLGAGAAMVNVLQTQIDASAGAGGIAGRVTVALDAAGVLQFTTTNAGVNSRLTLSSVTDMQGLVLAGFDIGEQTSGTQAQLVGNVSIVNGFNFNSGGPHTFDFSVDGSAPKKIVLTGDTGTPAVFSGTVDVSAGVDFTGAPHTFDLTVSGNPIVVVNLGGVDTTLAASPTDIAPPGIVTHVQTQIDAILGSGVVTVDLDLSNQLRFTSAQTGNSASITVSNPTGNVAANVFPVVGTAVGTQLGATGVVNLISGAINAQLGPLALGPVTVGISPSNFLTITSPTFGGSSQISIGNVVGTLGAIFPGGVAGAAFSNNVTVGGIMDIQLEGGATLTSSLEIGLLGFIPEALDNYLGYQVSINSGQGRQGGPVAGDTFLVDYNTDGTADNRNGLAMLQLNTKTVLANSNLTYQGAYGQLVEEIGIQASQTRLSFDASQSLLRQSKSNQQAISGVSLDEEAARLIQLEQHFNASAQLIALARELFNAILEL